MPDHSRELLEEDISVHIFTASAGMVGVCLTVIGLLRITSKLKNLSTIGDELMAVDALALLTSCLLAYVALRIRRQQRRYDIERVADVIFLIALSLMVVICGLIAYEMV